MGLFNRKKKEDSKPNDAEQFNFNIPLSMSLPEILENTGITIDNMIESVLTNIEDPENYPPSIKEMKSFKESIDSFHDIAQTQQAMLGMDKTEDEKKRELLHVLKLNNNESKHFVIDASEIEGGLAMSANVYTGTI